MMNKTLAVLLLAALPSIGLSEDEEKAEAEVSVSGYFEPVGAAVISPGTKKFSSLKIQKIVPHGTPVKKDQAIVWFETEAIDKQLDESEHSIRKGELSLAALDIEAKQLGERTRLEREAAQRARKSARQDYDNYVRTLKDERVETAEANLKSSRDSLEYAMEELTQLEQMYKEDELTEESEEIVLKRARRAVETAQLRLKHSETATVRTLQQSIPREATEREVGQVRGQLDFDKQIREIDRKRKIREMEIAQERKTHAKAEKDLCQLREDRKRMVLRAPAAGTVYHGTFTRGKLSDKPSALKQGAAATGSQELLTVVRPRALQVRIDLPEKELAKVAVGSKASVTAGGFPDLKINGTVKSISMIPMSSGKFDCVVGIKLPKNASRVVAGMAANVKIKLSNEADKK